MIAVDRVEGEHAVLDIDGQQVSIPARLLPPGAAEGSVLVLALADASAVLDEARARLARLAEATPEALLGDDVAL